MFFSGELSSGVQHWNNPGRFRQRKQDAPSRLRTPLSALFSNHYRETEDIFGGIFIMASTRVHGSVWQV